MRTINDEKNKNDTNGLFDSLGLNLSTYPKGFFELFGSGKNLGLDEEPKEILLKYDTKKI